MFSKTKRGRRWLGLTLALVLCLTLMPAAVVAVGQTIDINELRDAVVFGNGTLDANYENNIGDANGNIVNVNENVNSLVAGALFDDHTENGERSANGNAVNINRLGYVYSVVIGAYNTYPHETYNGEPSHNIASGNTVKIDGGIAAYDVYGAAVYNGAIGTATENKVSVVNGGSARNLYGADASAIYRAYVTGNEVLVDSSAHNAASLDIFGGYALAGGVDNRGQMAAANGNKVTIRKGTINSSGIGEIFGGYARVEGREVYASNNEVTISGGTVAGTAIYGGCIDSFYNIPSTAMAIGNTVTISGNPQFSYAGGITIYGGECRTTAIGMNPVTDAFTDNTLVLDSSISVGSLRNFNTIKFGNGVSVTAANTTVGILRGGEGTALYLEVAEEKSATLTGNITGDGDIEKTGKGTLALETTDSNARLPEITVSAGTLIVGNTYNETAAITAAPGASVTNNTGTDITVNGQTVANGTSYTNPAVPTDPGTPPVSYPVIISFSEWRGSGEATAKIDGDYMKFSRLLKNGVAVDPGNYTITAGSTIITLKESYLKTLATGTYAFVAEFLDGQTGDITLKVTNSGNATTQNLRTGVDAKAPQTGDMNNIVVWEMMLAASVLVALCGLLRYRWYRRRRQAQTAHE